MSAQFQGAHMAGLVFLFVELSLLCASSLCVSIGTTFHLKLPVYIELMSRYKQKKCIHKTQNNK
jgi:hypothetical protein